MKKKIIFKWASGARCTIFQGESRFKDLADLIAQFGQPSEVQVVDSDI